MLKVSRCTLKTRYSNTNQMKAGVAILISGRADFKVQKLVKDKIGSCIL